MWASRSSFAANPKWSSTRSSIVTNAVERNSGKESEDDESALPRNIASFAQVWRRMAATRSFSVTMDLQSKDITPDFSAVTSMGDVAAAIQAALNAFVRGKLVDNARALFKLLGYQSQRTLDLFPNTAQNFVQNFDPTNKLSESNAFLSEWQAVDLLFQHSRERHARFARL